MRIVGLLTVLMLTTCQSTQFLFDAGPACGSCVVRNLKIPWTKLQGDNSFKDCSDGMSFSCGTDAGIVVGTDGFGIEFPSHARIA